MTKMATFYVYLTTIKKKWAGGKSLSRLFPRTTEYHSCLRERDEVCILCGRQCTNQIYACGSRLQRSLQAGSGELRTRPQEPGWVG